MKRYVWLNELESLVEHFSSLGISPDIASMSLSELRGLYRFLKRMKKGST